MHTEVCTGSAGFIFDGRRQIGVLQQTLQVNATFPCSGVVRAWRYILLTPTTETFFFLQVWRFINANEVVRIGSTRINVLSNLTYGNVEVIHRLEKEEQIHVKEGDFIGAFAPFGSRNVPIASKPFGILEFATELYSFAVVNRVLPSLLDLTTSDGYARNTAGSYQAITGKTSYDELGCSHIYNSSYNIIILN